MYWPPPLPEGRKYRFFQLGGMVLATDISQKALASAKRGVYELPDTIPPNWKKRYFRPSGSS